jgi:hypothetical protein
MKLKKLAGLLVVGILVSGAKFALAANNVGIDLHVTVNTTININIVSASTATWFPAVDLGDTVGVVSTNTITLQNDSNGLNVMYRMAANDDQDWQIGGSTTVFTYGPGADIAVLRAMFQNAAPTAATFNLNPSNYALVSHTGPVRKINNQLTYPNGFRDSTATVFAGTGANSSGANVAPGVANDVNVWFQFIPASTASVVKNWGARTLSVSVVAELP